MELPVIISVTIKILIFIFSLMGVMLLFNLILAGINLINTKAKKDDLYIQLETNPDLDKKEHISFTDKIDITISLLNIINVLIDSEIGRSIETVSMLGKDYELLKYDNDVKRISESVFNAFIKDETFLSNRLVITDEYIMKYISEEVMTRLLRTAQAYNLELRQE